MKLDKEASKRLGVTVMKINGKKNETKKSTKKTLREEDTFAKNEEKDFTRDE